MATPNYGYEKRQKELAKKKKKEDKLREKAYRKGNPGSDDSAPGEPDIDAAGESPTAPDLPTQSA